MTAAKARFAELLDAGLRRRDIPVLLAVMAQPLRHGTRLDRQLLVSHLEAGEHLAGLYRSACSRCAVISGWA